MVKYNETKEHSAHTIVLKKLIITSLEAKDYKKKNLRYTDFSSIFNLNFRVNFFLRELLDDTSILTFYLLPEEIEEYKQDLLAIKDISEVHLQDALINTYKDLPIEERKKDAMEKLKKYKAIPPKELTFNQRFFQEMYEHLLETIGTKTITQRIKIPTNYFPLSSSLVFSFFSPCHTHKELMKRRI